MMGEASCRRRICCDCGRAPTTSERKEEGEDGVMELFALERGLRYCCVGPESQRASDGA